MCPKCHLESLSQQRRSSSDSRSCGDENNWFSVGYRLAWWAEVAGGPGRGTCGAKIATAAQGCTFGWDALATSERGGAERHGLGHPKRRRAAIAVTGSSEGVTEGL
jgi:hypothetical protein